MVSSRAPALRESVRLAAGADRVRDGLPKDQRVAAAFGEAGRRQWKACRLGLMYERRGVDRRRARLLTASAKGHHARTARARSHPGMLPDCMRPIVPPPEAFVADEDDRPFGNLSPDKAVADR
jgi:hypothetical protein